MISKIAAALLASAALTGTASAQQAAGVFSKGRAHFIVTAGTGYAFDESYFVLGLGGSYYLIDGLSAGLFVESWSGSDPKLLKITPSLQYVFHQVPTVKPYVGVFYRRTEIAGFADLDSVGGRVGAYLQAGRNAYLGAGLVYESYFDCSVSVYRKCDSTYGEISITFAF